MNSSLLLGLRDALHPVHTTLVFQARVDAIAFDQGNDFLKAAYT